VVGAFIDGEAHDQIMRGREVVGLALDPQSGTLYGCTTDGHLVTVRTEDRWTTFGAAREVGPTGFAALGDLAYEPLTGQLYALDAEGGRLVQLDRRTGGGTPVGDIGVACTGLAAAPDGRLYAGGSGLVRIDAGTGRGTRVGSLGGRQICALAPAPDPDALYGLDGATGEVLRIDTRTGAASLLASGAEAGSASTGGADAQEGSPAFAAGLAFDARTKTLYGGRGHRLVALDPSSGAIARQGYPGYRDELGPLYQYYQQRMRRVKQNSDLTFVYTYVLAEDTAAVGLRRQHLVPGREAWLVYGLDAEDQANEELHSQTGSVDPDVATESIRDVELKGTVSLSDIVYWQEWGLLKSAYAPVYDGQGAIRATAGADVNVNKIRAKTRSALLRVCLVGVASLLVAGAVSLYITGRLSDPIRQLKEGALRVAAGEYGYQIPAPRLTELGELTVEYNRISNALRERMEDVARANRELGERRSRRELLALLQRDGGEGESAVPAVACGRLGAEGSGRDSSGWVVAAGVHLMWAGHPCTDEVQAARLHRDVAVLAERLLQRHAGDRQALVDRLAGLLSESVASFAVLDPAAGCAWVVVRQPVAVAAVGSDGTVARRVLGRDACLPVPAGQALVFSATPAGQVDGAALRGLEGQARRALDAGAVLRALQRRHAEAAPSQGPQAPGAGGVLGVLVGPGQDAAVPPVQQREAVADV
ncbi:MAG: HAMP domain-containing protein, partial [Candidatus Latescibacterota bacterium]